MKFFELNLERILLIRQAVISDAQEILKFQKELDQQTDLMLLYPEERQDCCLDIENKISQLNRKHGLWLLAEDQKGTIIGNLTVDRSIFKKIEHLGYVVVGVLKEARHRGIGDQLFNSMDQWALNNHIHRLELTVMQNNLIAQSLYKKHGFVVEGLRQDSIFQKQNYVSEFYMAKIFNN
ncbi:acetyltransferase [Oenococcus oeni ATCC BAA-1163]|uniref:Acetyltransferase n=1 Tax=Oenococcus oeni ATCC BAA-1163 TaxID=379360 RepID=A0NHQ0_OENOE|nr:GNAT family N-acetyltransferase [Oenococcus oeni]EAV39973.1 acetyltransferase [Oenococcus oeni ATCC BAA-1163]